MEILKTISAYCEKNNLSYLIAGGHAVNVYGISRQTGDLDLIVARDDKDKWLELLTKLNYKCFQNDDRFARFKPDKLAAWPIDLMFVDSMTFSKMITDAHTADYGPTTAKTVSAAHLVTLKIHALKYYQQHREARDYNDLIGLLKTGTAKLTSEQLSELCNRYATHELYDRLVRDLKIVK
jgi:phosphorylcholine metabolism protein LicD